MPGSQEIKLAVGEIAQIMERNAAMLSELDAAMGDGDLGIYMKAGFAKAYATIAQSDARPGPMLLCVGASLMEEAPSTLGTLLGLFFRRMGKVLGEQEDFSATEFCEMLKQGCVEIEKRGKAKRGDKTILDTLWPATEAFDAGLRRGLNAPACLKEAYAGAERGLMESTQLMAVHGRPSYFGEKTIGLQDGGATVGVLIMQGICQAYHII